VKRNMLLVVLLVAIGALVVVAVRQQSQIGELKATQESKPQPVVHAPPAPPPPQEQPAPESPPDVPPPPATTAAPTGGSASNYFANLAVMMKDPATKEMIRSQQKMMLNRQYGALTRYLNLPADKQSALQALLLERQMALVDSSMAMMGGSADERKKATEDIKATKDEYDKKIRDLLGPQDFDTFHEYEQTIGERTQVQLFKDTLTSDLALTDRQEYDLVYAMYDERKALPPSSLLKNQNADPSQLTEASIHEALQQMEELQKRYAQRAAGILTPAQLERFTEWQEQISAMQAAGLKMALQMFGNKGTTTSGANPSP
jgi:hypothetical protein